MKAEFFKTSDKKSSRLCLMFENLERWTKGVEKYENIKPRLLISIVRSPLEVRTKKPACRKSRWLHPLTQKFVFDLIDNGRNYY